MGFGGGGDDSGIDDVEVTQPPRQIAPLENSLVAHSQLMLDGTGQFTPYGGGFRLTPQALFGQTYVPGPNPTIFGNPYSYNQAQQYFGQSGLQNGGSNALFPMSPQPQQQQQQQQNQAQPTGIQQLAQIFPGLFNMQAFQQPAQSNAGGQQQQQTNNSQQNNSNNNQQQQQPQMSPQEQQMQQQFLSAIQNSGAFYPTNYQNGVFT